MNRLSRRLAPFVWAGAVLGLALSLTPAPHNPAASRAPRALAPLSLQPGARYFTLEGRPIFLTGRTPIAQTFEKHLQQFDEAAVAGETVLRITLHHGIGQEILTKPAGAVDESWAALWDAVFSAAAERGLYVLPVLSGHALWKDQSAPGRFKVWEKNPFNAALGGPAASPADLFKDTPCQRLFLDWIGRTVWRFQHHPNILGWETFSEIDLPAKASGVADVDAVALAEKAAERVRRNDPRHRPVTVSLSGVHVWPTLWKSRAADIVQIHPYPGERGRFDLMATIARTMPDVAHHGKPVIIGEEGLSPWWEEDLNLHPRAAVAYRQAVWSSMMSGAALGGMFWFLSGYGDSSLDGKYPRLLASASAFAKRFDFSRLCPVKVSVSPLVEALALGGAGQAIGYVRDSACVFPDWPSRPVHGAAVTLPWKGEPPTEVLCCRPEDLSPIGQAAVEISPDRLTLMLPTFEEDLLFEIQ